jgi:hypothetical protein
VAAEEAAASIDKIIEDGEQSVVWESVVIST